MIALGISISDMSNQIKEEMTPTVEQYSVKHSDMINSGYEQCKTSNEVCSVNNDCCSNCCTSFTYSSMTCQDECPEKVNADTSTDSHGNVVWKGKQQSEEALTVQGQSGNKIKEPGKISRRQQRENQNIAPAAAFTTTNIKNVQSIGSTKNGTREKLGDKIIDFKPSLEIGEIIVKKIETKPNKDIGIRIIDDSRDDSNETETKTHENIEIGLSVINITKGGKDDDDEDSGENQNTDIGTPILKIREKSKGKTNIMDRSTDSTRIKFGSQRRYSLGEEAERKTIDTSRENKDLGGNVITVKKTKTEKTAKPDQNFNNLKIINSNTSQEIVTGKGIDSNPIIVVNGSKNTTISKDLAALTVKNVKNSSDAINRNTTPKSNMATTSVTSCADASCESSQSFADDIKKILIQKLPNLMALSPSQEKTSTSKKPVCKTTGSTCKHPEQCCSQCCAVSDGVFQCFDKGTDECQSSLPGAIAPKCKTPGDHCETHSECCGNKCTDCGRSSKCDNEHGNICRLKTKQPNTKLCKNLGDTCKEASECCTQCCAVSDGAFKCFEEGTHECQPGDNVSNTTISDFVEI
ncbi:hypothetical protein WDU94_009914 [Cyamophila willieti]